jgi:foldase protein PrsA
LARSETGDGLARFRLLDPMLRRLSRVPLQVLSGGLVGALAVSMIVVALVRSPSPSPAPSRRAASVDGTVIPVSDVAEALRRFEATAQFDQLAGQTDPAMARRQYERIFLTQQIKLLVLRSHLEEFQIDVSREVERRLETMSAGYPSEEAFHTALESSGYTAQRFSGLIRDQVTEELLRAEVTAGVAAELDPGEPELREYYREHLEDYRQTEVQHILVEERSVARELSIRLRSASAAERGSLLGRLAREHSTDAGTAEEDGDLGWVSAPQLLEPFVAAMDRLDLGEVSLPVSTDLGFHVIRVTGRRVLSFERVRDEVSQRLTDIAAAQAWTEWLLDAYGQGRIELNPRYGAFDSGTGQIMDAPSRDAASPS